MSWWISLEDEDGSTFESESKIQEGGTQIVGGTRETTINVTYNYGGHFEFTWLHEKSALETILQLADAVEILGTERSDNYWERTPGNAGYVVSVLLGWAKEFPNGIWKVN